MAEYATVAPTLGPDRVLNRAGASVVLSPSEATIVETLLAHSGSIVPRDDLERLLWPDGKVPGHRSLDYAVQRLRRRIADLDICINTSRGKGFVICVDAPASKSSEKRIGARRDPTQTRPRSISPFPHVIDRTTPEILSSDRHDEPMFLR